MMNLPNPLYNHLIANMPEDVRNRVMPHLELVSLKRGDILYDPHTNLRHLYFPIDTIVVLVCVVKSGAMSEVSMVGNEGLVGVLSLLSDENPSHQAQVLSDGYAYRVPKKIIRDEFNQHNVTMQSLLRYTQALITQMTQTSVCNKHHSVKEQLCRVLLLSLDRVPCNNLTMTHELLSRMLGVRREGITESATYLHNLGVIDYCRGQIKILDRVKLEQESCECYGVIKSELDRLVPSKLIGSSIKEEVFYHSPSHKDPNCPLCFKYKSCVYLKKKRTRAKKPLGEQLVAYS